MKAISNVAALAPEYKSQSETAWANIGAVHVAVEFEARVMDTRYEPVTLRVPGGKYTPDFLHILENGQMVFVEIKGSKHQRNYRDARSKLRAAAAVYPFWTFCEAVGGRNGFMLEVIND